MALGTGLYLLGLQTSSFDLGFYWLGFAVYALGVARIAGIFSARAGALWGRSGRVS